MPTIKKYSQSNKHLLNLSNTQSKKSLRLANPHANLSFSHHTRNLTLGAGSSSKDLLSQLMQKNEFSEVNMTNKTKIRDVLIHAYSNVKNKSMKGKKM